MERKFDLDERLIEFGASIKELRETFNCLRLIKRKNWYKNNDLNKFVDENNQLISIFVKSIETAQKNNQENVRTKKG